MKKEPRVSGEAGHRRAPNASLIWLRHFGLLVSSLAAVFGSRLCAFLGTRLSLVFGAH